MSLRIALAIGFGRPLMSTAGAVEACRAVRARPWWSARVAAAASPASTPSTLSWALSWLLAASTAPWAASATLPGSLSAGAPVWTLGAGSAGGDLLGLRAEEEHVQRPAPRRRGRQGFGSAGRSGSRPAYRHVSRRRLSPIGVPALRLRRRCDLQRRARRAAPGRPAPARPSAGRTRSRSSGTRSRRGSSRGRRAAPRCGRCRARGRRAAGRRNAALPAGTRSAPRPPPRRCRAP